MYIWWLVGSITVFHACVMHVLYHLPSGSSSFRSFVVAYRNRNTFRHVAHTGVDGLACRGNRYSGCRGLSCPLIAHSHISCPLLVHMSASVVTPRNKRHRWACTHSIGLMPGRLVRSSIMKLSLSLCGWIHLSGSSRMWLLMLSRNSQACVT